MLKQASFSVLHLKYYNNVHRNMLYIHNNAMRLKYRTQFPAHNLHVATSFVFSPEYITLAAKANVSSVLLSFALALSPCQCQQNVDCLFQDMKMKVL